MYKQFLRDRIGKLRVQRDVSEYQMSMELGRSRGYIQNICSGKSMPSVEGLFEICDYFEITPAEFFDQGIEEPMLVKEAIGGLRKLNHSDLSMVVGFINRLAQD